MNSLSKMHAGRALVLPIFRESVSSLFSNVDRIKVAIVGGSMQEPEIDVLKEVHGNFDLKIFNIDLDSIYLDLNFPMPNELELYLEYFDLVICNQVLEHLFDVKQALENLALLTKPNCYLWVNCPSSNHKHGSPYYFSAGYQSELIEELLKKFNITTELRGEIGCQRLYNITHKQQYWPSRKILNNPFLRGSEVKSLLFPLKVLKHFFKSIESLTWNNKTEIGSKWTTETYYFGKKKF